ncbi:MAG: flagellar basal body-associated FliL family protein [Bacillota bacterium]|nr:flagellar basal body-associated FliL family protein [Bacillota bacterium]
MSEKKKEKKEGKKGGLIVIILLALMIVMFASFLFYFFFIYKGKASGTSGNIKEVTTVAALEEQTSSLDETIVNLSDTDAQRFLKVTVSVGYSSSNSKLKDEIEKEKKAIIRDAIISILRDKKAADFTDKGVQDIKRQIIDRVNPTLKNGKITSVYFSDLLVQ